MAPVKDFTYRLLSASYEIIFRERMSPDVQKFLVGTFFAAVGTLFGAALTFVFNILAARILGPVSYGDLSLVVTLSTILVVSMSACTIAMVKYASGEPDNTQRIKIISTSSLLVVLFTVSSTVVYVFFSPELAQLSGTSIELFDFAVALAVTMIIFGLTSNSLRILLRMRAYGLFSAVQSAIVLAVFLISVIANVRSWQAAAYSLGISYVGTGLILAGYLRKYFKPQFDQFWSRKILNYSAVAFPGILAGALMGVDKVLVNKFMTTADVGLYSAYFLPSISIALMVWGIFNAAFFPIASRSNDKQAIFRKVNRAAPFFAVLFAPLIILLETIIFVFYGRQYFFSLGLSFLFAIAATFFVLYQCYSALMGSVGTNGAKVSTLGSIIALVVLIGFNVALIPVIGISGAAVTLILAYLLPSVYLFSKRRVLAMS